ncbi:ANK3 [Symbiodinium sp. CCMP2592]|nr:ANK3 [Symbiodinium sp. CCMP2592]
MPSTCSIDGLGKEWEAIPDIRNSLREGKPLIHEVSEKQVDIKLPSKFKLLIKPILVRMHAADKKMPGVDPLRAEIKTVLDLTKRLSNEESEIDKYTWLIRKQLTFIKAKCRRREVSTAVDEDEDAYDDDGDSDEASEEAAPEGPSSSAGAGGDAGAEEDVNAAAGGVGPVDCDDLHDLLNELNDIHSPARSALVPHAEQPSEDPIFPSHPIIIDDGDESAVAPPTECSHDSGRALDMPAEVAAEPAAVGSTAEHEVRADVVDGSNGGSTEPGSTAEVEASAGNAEVKPGWKVARLAELRHRIEQLKEKKQVVGPVGSASNEGPSEVSASIKNMPGSLGPVLDNQETLPHDIFDVETPPPSEPPSSKRKESSEPSAAELREDYQLRQCKTKKMKPRPGSTTDARLPYNPYSPEVLDNTAKGSEDPFTPDEKVAASDIGRVDQLAVRAKIKAQTKRGEKKKGDDEENDMEMCDTDNNEKNAPPENDDKKCGTDNKKKAAPKNDAKKCGTDNKKKKKSAEAEWETGADGGGYSAEEWEHWLQYGYGYDEGDQWDEDGHWDGDQWVASYENEEPKTKPDSVATSKKRKAEGSPEEDEPEPSKKAARPKAGPKAKAKAKASPKAKGKAKAKASAKKGAKSSAKAPEPEPENDGPDGTDDEEGKPVIFARRYRPGSQKMAMAKFDAIRDAFLKIVRPRLKTTCPSSFEEMRNSFCDDPFWTHCVQEFKEWTIDSETVLAACETAAESFIKKNAKK